MNNNIAPLYPINKLLYSSGITVSDDKVKYELLQIQYDLISTILSEGRRLTSEAITSTPSGKSSGDVIEESELRQAINMLTKEDKIEDEKNYATKINQTSLDKIEFNKNQLPDTILRTDNFSSQSTSLASISNQFDNSIFNTNDFIPGDANESRYNAKKASKDKRMNVSLTQSKPITSMII